jgi:hypothetical protein
MITGLRMPTNQNARRPERNNKTAHKTIVRVINLVLGYIIALMFLGRKRMDSVNI